MRAHSDTHTLSVRGRVSAIWVAHVWNSGSTFPFSNMTEF